MSVELYQRTSVIGVGAIIRNNRGEVLLGHRVKRGEHETWCLPGGHVEPHETFEQTARREIAEETGIAVYSDLDPIILTVDTTASIPSVTCGVVVTVRDGTKPVVREPCVFACWQWIHPSLFPRPFFPASEALLNAWMGKPPLVGWHTYFINLEKR
ncbi:NUDIX hydrolase [Gluconacetobacter sacchari DSM 12717]|uniref:NUDIX hydrolase n=2 Tax=Gluconacetobacter sacchari TaxID=92759 RepID=A0A7W4IGT4_9PROT|nr:NUDIX hydrolase [Gluconacetobacter sacchari]GBQ18756.1 NUDIX hydrolase [Gluconacetobacter sacchari DSM 12717]